MPKNSGTNTSADDHSKNGKSLDVAERKELEFLRSVVDQLPVSVFCKSVESGFSFKVWNKAAESLFGFNAQDVLGKNDYDFFPNEQADFFRQKDIETIKKNETIKIEEEPADTNNGKRWLRTAKVCVTNLDGTPNHLLGITQDITDEREAKNNSSILSALVEESKDFIFYTSITGNPVFMNSAVYTVLGWPKDTKHVIDHLPKIFSSVFEEEIVPLVFQGNSRHFESEVEITNAKSNEQIPVLLKVFPFKVKEGNSVFLAWIGTDLRSRKEMEIQITNNSRLAALGVMAGGIAHEINNPLAIVQGNLSNLMESLDDGHLPDIPNLKKAFQKMEVTLDRITKIIRGLRSFSRDAEKDPMILTSIRQILDETLAISTERIKRENVDLKLNIGYDFQISCRMVQISQVILNLLNNSLDAVGSLQEKWIKIQTESCANHYNIRITDSGKGIPISIQARVMDPFFTTKDVGKGTGLGLSISKGIIEAHHGRLYIDATSKNTSFVIEFPKT